MSTTATIEATEIINFNTDSKDRLQSLATECTPGDDMVSFKARVGVLVLHITPSGGRALYAFGTEAEAAAAMHDGDVEGVRMF
jgi:hypothetical protein